MWIGLCIRSAQCGWMSDPRVEPEGDAEGGDQTSGRTSASSIITGVRLRSAPDGSLQEMV